MAEQVECVRSLYNPKYRQMPGEFVYKGNLWAAWTSEKNIQAVEDTFEFLPNDILLSGYAKSGITFLSEIICLLAYSRGKQEYLQSAIAKVEQNPIYLRVPFIEEEWLGDYPMMKQKVQAMEYLDYLREHPQEDWPRIIKTHLPFESIDCAMKRMEKKARPRILYVYRNPKDAAVSMYNFYCGLRDCGPFQGSWDEFFEMWIDGWISGGDWRRVVPEWLRHAKSSISPRILPVSYELMKKDPGQCIKTLHHFLHPESDLDPTVLHVITERTSFEKMRANRMTNHEGLQEFSPAFHFMRRGQVGDWKNWFSDQQNTKFMAAYENTLEELEQFSYKMIFE